MLSPGPGFVRTVVALHSPHHRALRYWNMARQRHCRRLARNGKPGASLLTPSSNQLPRPARKAGFSTFESRSGRETDCLLEGDGFELSVPGRETVKPIVGDGTTSSKTEADLLRNRKFESI